MSDVTASHGIPIDFIDFFWYFHTFLTTIQEVLYQRQTFADCVSI